MTLALDFEVQHQPVHWDLDIEQLGDPFVVAPTDPETVADMSIVQAGLHALDSDMMRVSQDAIADAVELTIRAKDAAMLQAKQTALRRLPDLNSRPVIEAGWKWIPRPDLVRWRDGMICEIKTAASPFYIEGAPAVAARLGLRALAERGDSECDPILLAEMAGTVATKYSGASLQELYITGEATPLSPHKGILGRLLARAALSYSSLARLVQYAYARTP